MAILFVLGLTTLLATAALWLAPGLIDGKFGRLLAGLTLFMFATFTLLPLLDKLIRPAVVVCRDRVLWRRGVPGHVPVHEVPRAAIASATVFEGDKTVLLHGAGGELARFASLPDAKDMALTLGVPVHVWVAGEDPGHGGWLSRGAISFGGIGAMTLLYQAPADLLVDGTLSSRMIVATLVTLGIGALLFLGGHWLQARGMTDQQRRETASWLLDPLCRGRDPYTKGHIPWRALPLMSARLWLVRHIYGGPYPRREDMEPLVFEPGATEPRRRTG